MQHDDRSCVTQMHHARRGIVTPEMTYVAEREELPAEEIRDEVARGRMIIPANINHRALEPMAIGVRSRVKINANIGNSPTTSDLQEEVDKLHLAVRWGADTVMDLSTGKLIDETRQAVIDASSVPIGTVPIYQALSGVERVEDLTGDDLVAMIEHQAGQGVDYMTVHAGILIEHLPLVQHRLTGIVSRGGGLLAAGWSTTEAEPAVRTVRRHPRDLPALRRVTLARRRAAPGCIADAPMPPSSPSWGPSGSSPSGPGPARCR